MGLKVKKVHRVPKFEQEAWLEPNITLNTTKRQQARNKIEDDLYKLLNNCVYGKTCESKRKRMLVRIVRDYHAALREIRAFEFKSYKIFGENLAAFTSNPTKIYWDVPTIVGASVLELAKFHMYKFHYDILNVNYCILIQTVSCTKSKNEDLYREISEKRNTLNELDLSNYPKNQPLYDPRNKMVILKFKDEFPGDIITEFLSLKTKLYSIFPRSN